MDHTASSVAPKRSVAGSRIKKPIGIAIAAIVTLGATYLVGYLQGKAEVTRLAAQVSEAQRATESCRQQQGIVTRHGVALEARRSLDQAVTALDARNFGIAERQVKKAAQWLNASTAEPRLADLAKTLESFHLVATEDLGTQRKQIADWVALVDQLVVAPNP